MRQFKKSIWPYSVTVGKSITDDYNIYDIELWLAEQLGSFREQWNVIYRHNETEFYFRNQNDAVLFSLKWV